MTACQRVLLKLGTTHPTSQINWVWYQSAVCVLIFTEKTTSLNWTGYDLDQSEPSSHDSRVMARLPLFLFPLLWTNEKRLLLWLWRTGSPVYHMRSLWWRDCVSCNQAVDKRLCLCKAVQHRVYNTSACMFVQILFCERFSYESISTITNHYRCCTATSPSILTSLQK